MAINAETNTHLNRVYLAYRPALLRFLTLSTHSPEMAADLVQELYLRLPYLRPIPDSDSAIKAWLFKVATNMAADHFRTEKRHSELVHEHLAEQDETELTPTPEKIAVGDDQLRQLQATLEALPKVCKEVLYLSRIEGLTHQAIAERLGISKSWVEKKLVQALDHLRKSMTDD
jgi:RNA polymerase sigma factor (sigma-70 family)